MIETIEQKRIIDILNQQPGKIVLSNLTDRSYVYKKTVIQKITLKGIIVYQIEHFTEKQVFHENVEPATLTNIIFDFFPATYSQMNIFGTEKQWDFKMTKKGKLLKSVHERTGQMTKKESKTDYVGKAISPTTESIISHNRKKNYILKEGTVIPPLVDLGIFTKDGKIVHSMYDKYKQINRFLEIVEDVVKDYPNKNLHIIDFGCGKSYLTFILYYYLVELKGYQVHMTGLDLKEDVIKKCNATAKKYHYDNLKFELGNINGYRTTEPVDMVITLHACDTATDYALYNAITWNAGIILSVPCCQHELNGQIHTDELGALTRYGIVKERISALMTDSIRANLLEYCGYKTQLMEFIDIAHSPKNILIRAVKGNRSEKKKKQALVEVKQLMNTFHVEPTLYKILQLPDSD